jgi:hypothetical protein
MLFNMISKIRLIKPHLIDNKDGYCVLSTDRGITINFPSKYSPKHSNIFLIQDKMQTSFIFRISTMMLNK